jgi:hypothetical protein
LAAAEGKAEDLAVRRAELTDGIDHLGQLRAIQGRDFWSRSRTRLFGQHRLVSHRKPSAPEPVPGLAPGDGDHPGPLGGLAAERARASPDREHRVLRDFLGQRALAGHQQDLREDHPAVLAVECRHRVLVTLADPIQQAIGQGGTRIVHLRPPRTFIGE